MSTMGVTLKRVQHIEPMFKPPFGPPYGGRLCSSCGQWYPKVCFRPPKKGRTGWGKTCARCRLEAQANT